MKKQNEIYCNKCGRKLDGEDYLAVKKTWGYFSQNDGAVVEFELCEACLNELIKDFSIPAAESEATELL